MRHRVRPTSRMHEWVMKWLSESFNCSNPSLSPLLTLCSSSFHIATCLCMTAVSQMSGILPQPAASWVEVEHLRWFTLFYSFTHTNTHLIVWPWDYKWLSVFQASESVCVWDNNANNIITFTSYWRQPAVYRKKESNYWPLVCFRKHWQECVYASEWKSGIWNSLFPHDLFQSMVLVCQGPNSWGGGVQDFEVESWSRRQGLFCFFKMVWQHDSWVMTQDWWSIWHVYVLINNIPDIP